MSLPPRALASRSASTGSAAACTGLGSRAASLKQGLPQRPTPLPSGIPGWGLPYSRRDALLEDLDHHPPVLGAVGPRLVVLHGLVFPVGDDLHPAEGDPVLIVDVVVDGE